MPKDEEMIIRLEKSKSMKIVLVLATTLGLVLVFRSFLLDNIIGPITILFWEAWRMISQIDQNIYWVALIFLSGFLMIQTLLLREHGTKKPAYYYDYRPPSQLEHWIMLINNARVDSYAAEKLHRNLIELYNSIQDLEKRSSSTYSQPVSSTDTIHLPQSIQQFLFPNNKKQSRSPNKTLYAMYSAVFRSLRPRSVSQKKSNPDPLDQTLKWMENKLGIHYEK